MKKNITNKILICLLCSFSMLSCANFLDVDKELASEMTEEDIFSKAQYTRRFHRNILAGTPTVVPSYWSLEYNNPWAYLSDEVQSVHSGYNLYKIPINGYNASSGEYHKWESAYKFIRQANLFLEKAKPIINVGSDEQGLNLEVDEFKYLKAIAYFYRAFYHYQLLEQYGPVPIVDYSVSSGQTNLDFERASVDEVVAFIDGELDALIKGEGDYEGLKEIETDVITRAFPSKMVARALRAKLAVMVASPLLNGGFREALSVTNPDGKRLFPNEDQSKWQTAKTRLEEFLTEGNSRYELFKHYNADGTLNADSSIYLTFMSYNKETVWASNGSWGSSTADGYDRRAMPRIVSSLYSSIGVLQEVVDDYFMMDGLGTYNTQAIPKSPLYPNANPTVEGSMGFAGPGEDLTGMTPVGVYKMYINREPRFYANITYHGKLWPVGNTKITFHRGGNTDVSNSNNPQTGYLPYKMLPRHIYPTGTSPKEFHRPSIYFRLAELYLLYAEACNEVNPNDPNIFKYIDYVRERAGIPTLTELHNMGKMNIKGNKELQREAIQRESRVELFLEGKRYFDVRRWMICENTGSGRQGGWFKGMNMAGTTNVESEYFKVVNRWKRVDFIRAMYLQPIPFKQIQMSRKLVQNPGWDMSETEL